MSEETKIVGNTRQQQDLSSQMRSESKLNWGRNVLNGAGVVILILVGITLTKMELGLFWSLVVAVVLWVISNTLKPKGKSGSTVHPLVMGWWPMALKAAAVVIAAVTLLGSGIGMWTKSVVDKIDTTASCKANPEQPECRARANKKAVSEQTAVARRQLQRVPERYPSKLGHGDMTVRNFGMFQPFKLERGQRLGPVNQYNESCLYVIKTGSGELVVYSRPDFTSEPVKANMAENKVGVKSWGHSGPAYQVFYEAAENSVTIEIERRSGNNSCS